MPTYEEALDYVCAAVLHQNIDLTGPWHGWKIRGQYLVSPERDRIMVRELVGVLIHYRARFGHRTRKAKVDQALPANVIPFAQAATEALAAKVRAEEAKPAALRVQGGALRAP